MIYMIVNWVQEDLRYEILHYSHDLDDALRMHGVILQRYSEARLMVDVRVLDIYDSTMKIKAYKKALADAKNKTA